MRHIWQKQTVSWLPGKFGQKCAYRRSDNEPVVQRDAMTTSQLRTNSQCGAKCRNCYGNTVDPVDFMDP